MQAANLPIFWIVGPVDGSIPGMNALLRCPWTWIACAAGLAICLPLWRTSGVLDDPLMGVPRWAFVMVLSGVAIPGLTARAVLDGRVEDRR